MIIQKSKTLKEDMCTSPLPGKPKSRKIWKEKKEKRFKQFKQFKKLTQFLNI